MDLLGEYGGFEYIFMVVLTTILAPISEYSFFFKAIQKLYFVKSDERNAFGETRLDQSARKKKKAGKKGGKLLLKDILEED